MNVDCIRQALVSARAVLVTAHNEECDAMRSGGIALSMKRAVLERNINRLTWAIKELDGQNEPVERSTWSA